MSTASTDRRFKTARRVALLGLACLLVLSIAPASAAAAPKKPFTLDLGKRSDYVAQTNLVQCVGASMQMMLNMIEPGVVSATIGIMARPDMVADSPCTTS